VLAGDDIETPVMVDVGNRGGLARAEVDRVRLEAMSDGRGVT
jgi:hypothetical protein